MTCHDDGMGNTLGKTAVRRLDLGYFIRPASETGGSHPRVEPVLAYLVRHDNGLILFDTGIGERTPKPRPTTGRDAAPCRTHCRSPVSPSTTSPWS